MNTDTVPLFPIRMCSSYLKVARSVGIDLISSLCNIDDVKDLIKALEVRYINGTGEEPADDLYRLCIRIRDQYYSQFCY